MLTKQLCIYQLLFEINCHKGESTLRPFRSLVGFFFSSMGLSDLLQVLEKMRPIDKKLKYQVDKVVRTAASGGTDESWSSSMAGLSNSSFLI